MGTANRYKVLFDPSGIFISGSFPKFDFLYSLSDRRTWAEGMLVKDPDGNTMKITYPRLGGFETAVLVNVNTGARWKLIEHRKLVPVEAR